MAIEQSGGKSYRWSVSIPAQLQGAVESARQEGQADGELIQEALALLCLIHQGIDSHLGDYLSERVREHWQEHLEDPELPPELREIRDRLEKIEERLENFSQADKVYVLLDNVPGR